MLPGIEEALIGAGALIATGIATYLAGRWTGKSALNAAVTTVESASADIQRQIEATSTDVHRQIEAASADVKAQLEADRESRVWEKRATVYTDAIAAIRHEQKIRGIQIVATRIGTEQQRPEPPVDLISLEARLVAFSSPAVLAAQRSYFAAAEKFEIEYQIWKEDVEQNRQAQEIVQAGVMPPQWPKNRNTREELDRLRTEADKLSDEVIVQIRMELHGE